MNPSLLLIGAALALISCIAGSVAGWRVRGAVDSVRIDELKAFGDQWRDMTRERQAVIDRMRQDGFALAKPATVSESPDLESEGLKRAEQNLIQRRDDAHFIQRAKTDLMAKNPRLTEKQALDEAIRLRREINMEDPPT